MAKSRIEYEASPEIRKIISTIGRTEDIKLSPDNQRLAIIDFLGNKIFLFSIAIDIDVATPKIAIFDHSIISSGCLSNPHGLAFLGNDHIVVCNRTGGVEVFRIPATVSEQHQYDLVPLQSIGGRGFLSAKVKTPGSVDSYEIGENHYRILVCNNHWHFVTSHIIEIGSSVRIRNDGVLIENALKIPDGISVSADLAWIAISNHVYGEVVIYANSSELDRRTLPIAKLCGAVCPHGIRFSRDGKRVFVADAASQYLHVFEREGGHWDGVHYPSTSIRMLDDETFYAGRYAAREGGVKGIDLDSSNKVLITTHMHDVIAFYDLVQIAAKSSNVNADEMVELCRQRDQSLELHQKDMVERRWNLRTRAIHELGRFKRALQYLERAGVWIKLRRLYQRNRWSRESILDPTGPMLSLTTHGHRLELVFYAIESIGAGIRKPSRIILWLEDIEACRNPPETLRRLKSRGLKICHSEDFGPHTKYYPYIDRETVFDAPLVTADDDVLYPRDWLKKLIEAHNSNHSVVHCHRAHRMHLNSDRLTPYNEWGPCLSRSPSHLNFVTGVCGAIYPTSFLKYLKQQGRLFEQYCPKADDIWITVNAIRGGFMIAQVDDVHLPAHFPVIPGSQTQRLFYANVLAGGNQYQIMQTFSEMDVAKLRTHLWSERKTCEKLVGTEI